MFNNNYDIVSSVEKVFVGKRHIQLENVNHVLL